MEKPYPIDPSCPTTPPANWYLQWRAQRLNLLRVSEGADSVPPEELLQQVWRYQRLIPEKLRANNGRPVKVLHPGFWNREAGPDFKGALVQVGDTAPACGDIEIDIAPSGWEQHSHEGNPAYKNVILHVTWAPEPHGRSIPSVSLKDALDSSLAELTFWLGVQPKAPPLGIEGRCAAPLRSLEPAHLRNLLKQAAQARLRAKAEQLQARARQVGWEGALWEGLFAALGYKRNTWPMRRLAELRTTLLAAEWPPENAVLHLQSRLFGLSGFLPNHPPEHAREQSYVDRLWNIWWRESAQFRDHLLPPRFWNLSGIRPPNHPQRRLALAAHWLARQDLPAKIENWLERRIESPDLPGSLEELLDPGRDAFWDRRWTFRSAPLHHPHQLLGSQRVTDLAVNVVLPWLYVRACAGANEHLASVAESRYLLWPAGEDNSVLRLARDRLFGGVPANFLKTAADQQAVLQIVQDFCERSNALCQECLFPEMVSAAAAAAAIS